MQYEASLASKRFLICILILSGAYIFLYELLRGLGKIMITSLSKKRKREGKSGKRERKRRKKEKRERKKKKRERKRRKRCFFAHTG